MTETPPHGTHKIGDGPTHRISVTLSDGTLTAIRERVGKRGVSAYLETAAKRHLERDNLDELITDMTARTGEPTLEEVAAAEAELFGTPTGSTTA